jgi:hypothetical protein
MAKMPLAKHNDMVEAFPSDRTDQPLTIAVLPWRSRRDWPIPNTHRPEASDEDITVDTGPIADEITWPPLAAISLRQLATYPFCAWMRGCAQPQNFTAAMLKD